MAQKTDPGSKKKCVGLKKLSSWTQEAALAQKTAEAHLQNWSAKRYGVLGRKKAVLAQETVLGLNKKFSGLEKECSCTQKSCISSGDGSRLE